MVEGFTRFLLTSKMQHHIDHRDGVVHVVWFQACSLAPVIDSHLILLLFRLKGSTGCISVGTVRKHLNNTIQLVGGILFSSHLLQHMSKSEMCLKMHGLNSQERVVVYFCQIVVFLFLVHVSPKEEGR